MSQQLFEVRNTANKGKGLFATQDIDRGTLILAEEPLVIVPRNDDWLSWLYSDFGKFTKEQRKQYSDLYCPSQPLGPPSSQNCSLYAEVNNLTGEALKNATRSLVHMHEIFFANGVELDNGSVSATGVFLNYSRINHSCCPNVANHWNVSLDKETVFAIRDIAAGEELLTSYVNCWDTKEDRQSSLQKWGFTCDCEVCSDEDGETEKRRKRLSDIDRGLAMFHMEPKAAALMAQQTGCRSPKNEVEALRQAEEMVALLKEEQLNGMRLCQAYRACSNYSLDMGLHPQAIAYARKELEIERIYIGDDTDHLDENMEGAKFWLQYLENVRMDQE